MQDKAEVIANLSMKVAYGASGGTFVAGWALNEIVAAAGLALGIATFAVNWYYRHRHLQLARQQVEPDN